MSLTTQQVRGFKPKDKPYKKGDERGLYLLVKPNGSKLWHLKYRFGGREKKMPIGPFPEVGLAQARHERDRARLAIADGIDPMRERKREKAQIKLGAENTFASVAQTYIEEKMVREGRAEATLRKARWFLDLLKPAVGNMPLNDVDPQLMLAALKKLEAKGNLETAKKCRSFASRVFRFSGGKGYIFPAFHTPQRPMSENTINAAFRRMGFTKDEVTAHGLRSTASTMLNESGLWHPDAIERALAHGDSNAIRGVYNRGNYWDERVKMAQWWSDNLDMLRKGQ